MSVECKICGRLDAKIRESDQQTVKSMNRAHVDCPAGHSQYRRVEPPELNGGFTFCESETGNSRWHLRKLDNAGLKFGGGITTACCCGLVKVRCGWDINVVVTPSSISGKHVNQDCVQLAKNSGLKL